MNVSRFLNFVQNSWKFGILKPLVVYVIWLSIAWIYYCCRDGFSPSKGLYYSVVIGYSIGYGVLTDPDSSSKIFTIWHNLVGCLILAGWVSHLLSLTVNKKSEWHLAVFRDLKEKETSANRSTIYVLGSPGTVHVFVWLVYLVFGISWTCGMFGWSFVDGLYFASSTLTTLGCFGIPKDSPEGAFTVVALFIMSGVPLTALAIGHVASHFVEVSEKEKINEVINKKLTMDEVNALNVVRNDPEMGFDKHDYLLLLLLRQNMVDVDFIASVYETFDRFEKNAGGIISVVDLIEEMKTRSLHPSRKYMGVDNHEHTENVLHSMKKSIS